ncbi:MAG: cobalamin-binding protein [Salinisphaera sp.]|nr:cobalamin-binding protein [Salinisphaera sp.]
MRIVSLLPSATEIICALGLQDQLVGVTHECDYPPAVRGLPEVTITRVPEDASSAEINRQVNQRRGADKALYSLNHARLEALRPDLIVTQALCGVCAVAEAEVQQAACALPGNPAVVNLEPECLADIYTAIRQVAQAAGVEDRAQAVIASLQARVAAVAERARTAASRPRVVLLEWLDPPFCCGHWNPELIQLAGGVEGLGKAGQPSRGMHWDEVIACQPQVVVIACCGFDVARTLEETPLLDAVPGWRTVPAAQNGRVFVTDGSQYFSRPGPRLVDSVEIMAHAIDPRLHPLPDHLEPAVRIGSPPE